MINQIIVDILVRRINEGWIYPKTGLPLTTNDILKEEYKTAVEAIISAS
ncbi:hypothetical protein [Vallitalea maricola]|uniref:Uncharacterized protein n=1 Tax=Vallitalea maricola TaxID=3074433 RepID=A0ACB5UE41_9FIRM|nr:hypothetical protein AN2V17_04400 [Vallitalea sp. AN17-2]